MIKSCPKRVPVIACSSQITKINVCQTLKMIRSADLRFTNVSYQTQWSTTKIHSQSSNRKYRVRITPKNFLLKIIHLAAANELLTINFWQYTKFVLGFSNPSYKKLWKRVLECKILALYLLVNVWMKPHPCYHKEYPVT